MKRFIYKNATVKKIRQFFWLLPYFFSSDKKAIIFLIPFGDIVNGGVMSINNIFNTSKETQNGATVLLATDVKSHNFIKFTKFNNNSFVNNIDLVLILLKSKFFRHITIHIPEYYFNFFLENNIQNFKKFYSQNKLTVNILNQKIDEMPTPESIKFYTEKYGAIFTITCAHKKYSTNVFKEKFNVPYHFLSVNLDHNNYIKTDFSNKENLILISPDQHPLKESILAILKKELPFFEIIIINKMTFEEYKLLVSKSKFQITFGEGLDGYFIEPYFSHGIGFAVYNEEFFTPEYKNLNTVYDSYENLKINIVEDILQLYNNEKLYNSIWEMGFNACYNDYNYEKFKNNLIDYYNGNYKTYLK